MRWLTGSALYLACLVVLALGGYEVVAKSPRLLGSPLPGWSATRQAERLTRWRRPTGWLPLDRALHEGVEASRYYRIILYRGERSSRALASRSASRDTYAS